MKQVIIKFAFTSGAGGVFLDGENIPHNLHITSGSPGSYTVSQSLGHQTIAIAGSAPSGGSLSIQVEDATTGAVLSPCGANRYTQNTFSAFITYYIL